jgi:hypothetical protein
MANTKQSDFADLTETTIALGDKFPLVDISDTSMAATGTNKEITVQDVMDFMARTPSAGYAINRVKQLTAQHSVSTTACTEVTDLTMAVEAGTFSFEYKLIVQSATITVGPQFNFNFDGTTTKARWWFQYADLSSTLLAAIGTAAHDTSTSTLGFQMAKAEDDMATTAAGNMGPIATTNAVQTAATDILYKITGLIVVGVAGNLELWHGSETATATSVEVGSSLVVVRTA